MTIRHSILSILSEGPCYGNQLRAEFERRTGGTWPVNVGQIYTTLDRIERDRLATKSEPDRAGHVVYAITPAGAAAAHRWLTTPVGRPSTREQLAIKLALAITLPGADAAALVNAQRRATTAALERLRAESGNELSGRLIVDWQVAAAEAELRWLDSVEAQLDQVSSYGLAADAPRRGRPVSRG